MSPISRILVPVDFSDRSLGMLRYVKPIAERYGAEVVLLYVVNPVFVVPATGFSGPTEIRTPDWVLPEKAKQLEAFAVNELNGLRVRRHVYEGDPEAQIAAFAQTEKVDLVIMPTHGYGVVRRYLIGSVTAKVLHDVSCPVLTGAHIESQAPPEAVKFSNVVCAVNLSQHSGDTLAWASHIADDFAGTISLVHVIPDVGSLLTVSFSSTVKQELEEVARKDVEQLQRNTGVKSAGICIQEGDVARGVCSFARSIGADLVVIGRSAQHAGRLRSNAYAIIREAPCPVLSI